MSFEQFFPISRGKSSSGFFCSSNIYSLENTQYGGNITVRKTTVGRKDLLGFLMEIDGNFYCWYFINGKPLLGPVCCTPLRS